MVLIKAAGAIITMLVSAGLVDISPGCLSGTGPDPRDVEIVSVVPNGSGCPAGTAKASILDDGRFEVTYDRFEVDLAAGANAAFGEKFCQLLVELAVPAGKQIAVESATYRGSLSIGAGVTAKLRTLYYFTETAGTDVEDPVEVVTLATGPAEGDWEKTSTPEATAWSRCGGTFFFNAKGRLTLGGAGPHDVAHVAMRTTGSTVYTYRAQPCEPAPESSAD